MEQEGRQMTRNEAKDKMIEIMEAVEEAHGQCGECPFYGLLDEDIFFKCPFEVCPEIRAFEKREVSVMVEEKC